MKHTVMNSPKCGNEQYLAVHGCSRQQAIHEMQCPGTIHALEQQKVKRAKKGFALALTAGDSSRLPGEASRPLCTLRCPLLFLASPGNNT